MSGLVAVFGEGSETDLDPLIERLHFRGTCQEKEAFSKNSSMAVLSPSSLNSDGKNSMALDGYLLLSREGEALIGRDGEREFLDLFKEEGFSCFDELEGEFTLAFQGDEVDSLIARDPIGVRPLYFTIKEETLYLAPEIKALMDLKTPIKEVPPGSYYDVERGWVKYYQIPEKRGHNSLSLREAERRVGEILYSSVEERLTGVENLGVYLSGGLDSSIVAFITATLWPEPINTYTVGVEGSRDIEYASLVAERIGSNHHVLTYNMEEMLSVLEDVIYHLESFDCAYVRSSIPNFLAARMAAEDGCKVMLTGEGSDELFAGYGYLKELHSTREIEAEMEGFLENMSRTGLQRVDRMNGAHGLNCRVPFLKPALVELAQEIPLEWKLHHLEDEPVDKWILRRAFEKELGEDVAWREKEQFDEGSGSSDLMVQVASEAIGDREFERERKKAPTPVRNKEELYYYKIFTSLFPLDILPLVGRWTKTS